MEQIVYARAIWKPTYGTTRAEASMINALLKFAILTPPTGVCYEGAGFLTFKMSRDGDTIDADIESGELGPTRLVGGARQPFGPARITGRIVATRNRRELLRYLHDAERKLGVTAEK